MNHKTAAYFNLGLAALNTFLYFATPYFPYQLWAAAFCLGLAYFGFRRIIK